MGAVARIQTAQHIYRFLAPIRHTFSIAMFVRQSIEANEYYFPTTNTQITHPHLPPTNHPSICYPQQHNSQHINSVSHGGYISRTECNLNKHNKTLYIWVRVSKLALLYVLESSPAEPHIYIYTISICMMHS